MEFCPNEIRNSETLAVFKSKSVWNPDSCIYRLCKECIRVVAFMRHCLSSHIDFMNDFLHLGFILSDCICFCTNVFVNPGSTGLPLCVDPVRTVARLF